MGWLWSHWISQFPSAVWTEHGLPLAAPDCRWGCTNQTCLRYNSGVNTWKTQNYYLVQSLTYWHRHKIDDSVPFTSVTSFMDIFALVVDGKINLYFQWHFIAGILRGSKWICSIVEGPFDYFSSMELQEELGLLWICHHPHLHQAHVCLQPDGHHLPQQQQQQKLPGLPLHLHCCLEKILML